MGEYINIYKDYDKHRFKPKTVVTTQDREPEKNTGGLLGGIGYTAGKLGLGVAGVGEGVLDTGAAIFDVLRGDLESAKDRYKENVTGDLSRDLEEWYNPGGVMRFVGDTASGIGQSSVFLLDAVAPGLGTGLFFTGVFGQNMASAAEQTGNVGWRELGYGAASAGLEAVIGKAIGAGGQATKQLGGAILKSTGKTAAKKAAQTAVTKRAWTSVGKEVLKSAIGEGVEEGVSEVADTWLLQHFGIDEDAETSILDVLYAAGVGAVSGGLMTAGPAAINYNQTVKAGRAVKEAGEVDILLQRAKNAVAGATRAENRAAGEVIKGSDKYDKDANVFSRAASWNKATFGVNRRAKQESRQARQIRETLEKNIKGYEQLSEAVRNSEGGDALLGNMLGNVYLLENAYRVDLTEELMTQATPEMKQAFVDDINAKAKATGQKKTDYTVQDLDNDVDGIRRTYASSAVYEMMLEKMYGVGNATETGKETPTSPWDGMGEDEDMSDYKAAGEAENALLRAAVNESVPRGSVQAMLDEYRKGTDMTPEEFASAWSDGAHIYGRYGLKVDEGSPLSRMKPEAREAAMRFGRETEEAERKTREEKAKAKKKPAEQAGKKGTVVRGEGLNVQKLSDEQYAAYKASEVLAEVLSTEIVIETAITDKKGRTVNGYYDVKTNTIHININAVQDGKHIALYTLGHEVTHYIKEWSPKKFYELGDYVMERLGTGAEKAVRDKLEFLKKEGLVEGLDVTEAYDLAYEEVVADGMEVVLTDGTVLDALARENKTLWQKIKDRIFEIIEKIKKAYNDLSKASRTAQILSKTMDSLDDIEQLFYEGVREAGERTRKAGVTRMNEEKMHVSEKKMSIRSEYPQEIEEWHRDGRPDGESFVLGMTGDVLQGLGAIESDIYINGDKIKEILKDHPEMALEEIKKIPQILEDPVLILKSRNVGRGGQMNSRMVIFGAVKAENGQPVMSVLDLHPTENNFTISDMQKVTSAYTKTTSPVKFVKDSFIVYADKKRTASLLRSIGFQMPIELNKSGYIGSISYKGRSVNIFGEKFSDVFVEGQRKYSIEETDDTAYIAAVESGDMETAQKMVDEAAKKAGYKIKAYHGTNAEFTTFEYGHIGESSGVGILGDGFYFTDEKELSKQYGKRTLDCYIRIRNPYMATTGDLYNLDTITLENEGYDGVILKVPKGTIYMTFESEQIKSADPVTYDDNGNVIPLSERFKEDDPDIRYSIDETDETPAPFAAAEARMEAEAAARAEAKTKTQTETEGDEIPDVYEFVDEEVTEDEIEAEMSEGEELSDRDMLIDMAERLVGNEEENKILESYKAQYGEQKERQKKLDNLFSEMDTQKSILYTDENAEKRSAAAKRLKEISTEIEKISEELGAVDRELTKIKDMKAIKNLLVRERKTARKIYQEKYRRMGEARKEATATTNMRRSFYRIYSRLNTMLLKPNRKKHVHYSMQGMVAEALKTANIDLDATLRLEQLNTWLTRAEREAVRDEAKIERYKSLIHEQEKKVTHIKDQVAMLVSLFEEFSKSTESEIAYAANAEVMEQLKALQEEIGDRAPRWMTLEQLTALKDFYDMIYTRVTKANELFMSKKDVAVSEAGDTSATQVNKNKAPKVFERKERLPKALVLARNFLWQNMKPLTAFEVIGSSKLSELFGNVMDGEDVWARDVEAAYQFIRKLKDKTGFDKWDLKERMEVETSNGMKVKLSRGEIMSLYAYGFREQAEKHLTDGGFVLDPYAEDNIPEDDEKIKLRIQRLVDDPTRYRMDAVALGRLTGMLTEEQKTFVREMQTYLSDVMGEKGNEVSRKLYGVELFREKNYFPIKVSSVYLESHTGRTGDPNIKSRGMTKDTVPNANNPLILQDFMTVCSDHINSMSTYHAFVLPVEDLMRVLNYAPSSVKMDENGNPVKDEKGNYVSVDPDVQFNTVKAAIVAKYGQEAVSYIEQVIRDLNGGARRDAAASILDKGMTAFKRASTMASLSVIFQQPTSLFRAMAYVDPKYFVGKAGVLSGKKRKEQFDLLKKYAAVAVIKEMGGYDTNTGKRTGDYLNSKEYKDIREKMEAFFKPEAYGGDSNYRAEIFGKGAAIADEVTWVNIFSACIKEQSEKLNKAETSEEVLEAAGRRFTEVVRRTQVYDSTLTRNQLMRSKDTGAKMITTFMSEPSTVVNMVVDGIIRAERGDKAFAWRTAGGVAASILANALLVSLVYAARDDDEEKTFSEKYMSTLVTESLEGINLLEYLPIARDVMSIMKGYDVERSDMALIGQLVQSVENITSSKKSVPDKMMEVSGAVASFFGVPLKNIYRDARGLTTTVGDFFSDSAEKNTGTGMAFAIKDKLFGVDSSNGYQMYKAILSGDEAHYKRVAARFSTPEAAENALRTAMREHDERIFEAAEKRNAGDLEGYEAMVDKLASEGKFDRNLIIQAVRNESYELKKIAEKQAGMHLAPETDPEDDEADAAEGLYVTSDLTSAMERGDTGDVDAIIEQMVRDKVDRGKTEKEAKASLRSASTAYWKKRYIAAWEKNDATEMRRIRDALEASGLYGGYNDMIAAVRSWIQNAK